jgi:nucleoside-diphosphate-sugar epimerase
MTITSLVLGSSGLVGRCLCRYLEERGKTVIPYDIRRDPDEDLRYASIDTFHQPDEIYLLAWDVGGSRYLYRADTQESQLEWNLRLLSNTIPQLKESGVRWLFASSQLSGQSNAYGIAKSVGEYWTNLAGGRTVRLWNVYGEVEEENDRSHVMSDMIRQAFTNGEIHLLTDGKERRRFTFESDICRGLEMAMVEETYDIYNVAGYVNTSILEAAEIVAKIIGAEVYPGKKIAEWMDTSILGRLPDFEPQIGIEEGLKIMIERYRESVNVISN